MFFTSRLANQPSHRSAQRSQNRPNQPYRPSKKELIQIHQNDESRSLHGQVQSSLLRAAVYGANDGIVTTFAVVAGVAGAQLSANIVIILGIANMVADALSMGLGDYLGSISENRYKRHQLEMEKWEFEQIPEIELAELEAMYIAKGYSSDDAKKLVEVHKRNPAHAVELGFTSELDTLPEQESGVWKTGFVTFCAFIVAGSLPLFPYVLQGLGMPIHSEWQLPLSIIATAIALFVTGAMRTLLTDGLWWKNGLQMLGIGSIAAATAYILGVVVERLI